MHNHSFTRKGMNMIKKLLYYISDTVDPHINLATEQFLFDSVADDALILYIWQNQNTVVIGKNQNPFSECRTELLKKEGGALARRHSGGGAVFHDLGNLNFTFICSTENFDVLKHMQVIRSACLLAGIETELSGRNDILANGKKISGNAFYHSKGRSYHHGTLLINVDIEKLDRYLTPPKAKMEAKGVKSVRSRVINLCELAPALTCENMKVHLLSAAEAFFRMSPKKLGKIDCEEIASLIEHFSNWEYIYGSKIPFNVSCKGSLPFGNVNLGLCVKEGYITNLKLYTDSLDTELSSVVEKALLYLPFDQSAIRTALLKALNDIDATAIITLLTDQIFS